MIYRDIIREMERNGDYSEADKFERGLREHGYSEYEHVYRGQEADGMAHSYTGDCAERAAEELRYRERREQERIEEEMRREQEEHHRERQLEEEQYIEEQQINENAPQV